MDPIGNVLARPFDEIWRSPEKRQRVDAMATCVGAPLGLGFVND
jgi:hypothetical protein